MDKFRDKGIPFSTAVIDMDWHLTDIPAKYGSGWTGYTWNPAFFPNPGRFLDALHQRGMHVTLNVHPADGVRGHEQMYRPMAEALGVDWENEDKIPFDAGSRPFWKAYFRYLHHPNEEMGVDFWWVDWQQGTQGSAKGIDTLFQLNHLHFLDSGRGGKQPLTFSRYAGIGSHRYPVGFSGDTLTTWESLDFQPYFTATASNVGYTWWSHDIGGHMQGYRNDEMTVRWVQLGVFSPIMRLHSTCNEFYGKEPWNYSPEAEQVMTDFLRLRHRLIPYLYSMNYLTHREGLPLVRPMYYHHDVPEAYAVPNQYYFGTELLVCPITKPADPQTRLGAFSAWLPEGVYTDFFTGRVYRGGRRLKLHRDLKSIPVLVKAGGILPLSEDPMEAATDNPQKLEVHIFTGADGRFTLYEDRNGREARTCFAYRHGENARLEVTFPEGFCGVIPEDRCYRLVLRGIGEGTAVTCTGATLTHQRYDRERRSVFLNLESACSGGFTVELGSCGKMPEAPDSRQAIFDLLLRSQIGYEIKQEIYDIVCRNENPARILGNLCQLDLPEPLRDAVAEHLLAEC